MNTGTQSIAVRSQIHSYSELLQRIRYDLRIQHPEWVEPNGESPICDSYEARLIEQLEALAAQGANESIVAHHSVSSVNREAYVEATDT
jgi:hypothetical protein